MDDSDASRTEETPIWPEPPEAPTEPGAALPPASGYGYGYGQFSDPAGAQPSWAEPVWPPLPPSAPPEPAPVGEAPRRGGTSVWLVALGRRPLVGR